MTDITSELLAPFSKQSLKSELEILEEKAQSLKLNGLGKQSPSKNDDSSFMTTSTLSMTENDENSESELSSYKDDSGRRGRNGSGEESLSRSSHSVRRHQSSKPRVYRPVRPVQIPPTAREKSRRNNFDDINESSEEDERSIQTDMERQCVRPGAAQRRGSIGNALFPPPVSGGRHGAAQRRSSIGNALVPPPVNEVNPRRRPGAAQRRGSVGNALYPPSELVPGGRSGAAQRRASIGNALYPQPVKELVPGGRSGAAQRRGSLGNALFPPPGTRQHRDMLSDLHSESGTQFDSDDASQLSSQAGYRRRASSEKESSRSLTSNKSSIDYGYGIEMPQSSTYSREGQRTKMALGNQDVDSIDLTPAFSYVNEALGIYININSTALPALSAHQKPQFREQLARSISDDVIRRQDHEGLPQPYPQRRRSNRNLINNDSDDSDDKPTPRRSKSKTRLTDPDGDVRDASRSNRSKNRDGDSRRSSSRTRLVDDNVDTRDAPRTRKSRSKKNLLDDHDEFEDLPAPRKNKTRPTESDSDVTDASRRSNRSQSHEEIGSRSSRTRLFDESVDTRDAPRTRKSRSKTNLLDGDDDDRFEEIPAPRKSKSKTRLVESDSDAQDSSRRSSDVDSRRSSSKRATCGDGADKQNAVRTGKSRSKKNLFDDDDSGEQVAPRKSKTRQAESDSDAQDASRRSSRSQNHEDIDSQRSSSKRSIFEGSADTRNAFRTGKSRSKKNLVDDDVPDEKSATRKSKSNLTESAGDVQDASRRSRSQSHD